MALACCLCFFQGSKSWIALLVPILAIFASFSSGPVALLISITFSVFLVLFSTLFSLTYSKQKPIMVDNPLLKEAEKAQEKHQPAEQEKTLIKFSENKQDKAGEVVSEQAETGQKNEVGETRKGFLSRSQDLYSESDQFSSTSSEEEEEEDHSSDIEWPDNMEQRIDCSDDSISDEESLIEIAIPSGQFVSPDKDPKFNPIYSQSTADLTMFQKNTSLDFLAADMNEEDNLIEIDIYMGSIKCSSFQI